MKYSALEIATALAKYDQQVHPPTEEQSAIIESLHFAPTIVIAGAGSGKTETMAARVLWLVANGFATPEQILGLTFTNKAASELSARIKKRLRQLAKSGLISKEISGSRCDVFTYHSYAGRILQEDGVRIGLDVSNEPIGDAAIWQLAREVLYRGEPFPKDLDFSLNTLLEQMLDLSDAIIENSLTVEYLRRETQNHLEILENVAPSRGNTTNEETRKFVETLKLRLELLDRIPEFLEEKRKRGWYTFNDQMNLASDLVAMEGVHGLDIRERERNKYKFIILDEYQDTSPNQTRFLAALFGDGYPVTAVGDPNQAIYEWRGAGAETLNAFPAAFGGQCKKFTLLKSWRNDQSILDLANILITQIDQMREHLGMERIEVSGLLPSPRAQTGEIKYGRYFTWEEEAASIADEILEVWKKYENDKLELSVKKSFAVLARHKKLIPAIEKELSARNLPVEIIGFDGLIYLPEIADVLSLARIAYLPDSGSDFMRFATGPYLNLGARDIAALGGFLSTYNKSQAPNLSRTLTANLAEVDFENLDPEEFYSGSVIEALNEFDKANPKNFSEVAFTRLTEFANLVKGVRRQNFASLTDCLQHLIRVLNLDIEIMVRDGVNSKKRYIDNFLSEAARFARTGGNIFDFLSWIEVVQKEERGLKAESVTPEPGKVQIMTVHAAKGLEWDFVAVPEMAVDKFPDKVHKYGLWVSTPGAIPSQLRRDSHLFQHFQFPSELTSAGIKKAIEDLKDYWKERKKLEEYRLAYVAFTRAKRHLLITSAHFYETNTKPINQSEIAELVVNFNQTKQFAEAELENQEFERTVKTISWPVNQDIVTQTQIWARLVSEATGLSETQLKNQPILVALLEEFLSGNQDIEVLMPHRLSVSGLINLSKDLEKFALNLRRPMPAPIDPYSKRGTAFHLWLEKRFKQITLIGDDELFTQDQLINDEPLEVLKEKWLASKYATWEPVEVEMPFDLAVENLVLRGRIDAVYKNGDQYLVVDWKTGKSKTGEELKKLSLQLAIHKIALHRLKGIPLSQISAEFFYLGDEQIIVGEELADIDQLISIIKGK